MQNEMLKLETDPNRPLIAYLGWDNFGGERMNRNLLHAPGVVLQRREGDQWKTIATARAESRDDGTHYVIDLGDGLTLNWIVQLTEPGMEFRFTAEAGDVPHLRVVLNFNPKVASTTVLTSRWSDDGSFRFPALIAAPDFGEMIVSEAHDRALVGQLEGSREEHWVKVIVELPTISKDQPVTLDFAPLSLAVPEGLKDQSMWPIARTGFLNGIQPCSRWGDQNRPFSSPAGILGNNVVSDPASCSLWFYADQIYFAPRPTPEISLAGLLRRTINWWLDHRTRDTGEVICYWDYGNFLDANAGPIIAAWDYVQISGDTEWLGARIERIEFIADFLAKRDIDGDGLIEATQSGNYGTLKQPHRSCAWWDALNCGHKDGYTNALIYRAFRCLADLESTLNRAEKKQRYTQLADRLKAAYAPTLMNPKTGWLAWWKSEDGTLHDYASPTTNGLAIEYGLVDAKTGRSILEKLWKKMDEVGFKRLDLGIPPMLVPVPPSDYLQPDAPGLAKNADGTDTIGYYMNGGITAGHCLHFLNAHYVVNHPEPGDKLLRAMLTRQAKGGFENGVANEIWKGIDWTTWDGMPSGYEGYLADSFRFLQAVFLREESFRLRFYRPLKA